MIERNHDIGGEVAEHRHDGYDYWHPIARVHADVPREQLPAGHFLERLPLSKKLYLDRVEATPIQKMQLGASLEVGAVQSLMEGLRHHRYAASEPIQIGKPRQYDGEEYISDEDSYALFYAEWEPNYSSTFHRYLVEVIGEDVYVGYFPFDGRRPRLYGIHHKKQDVIKFLHRTHKPDLKLPELTLLTELNVPNITFEMTDNNPFTSLSTTIKHKQGAFFTRSIYGEFVAFPDTEEKVIKTENSTDGTVWWVTVLYCGRQYQAQGHTPEEATERAKADARTSAPADECPNNPRYPWYMFWGATGYIQLYEGKMFCYPDGSIRFLTPEIEQSIFREYVDLEVVQGDLIAYELEGHTVPEPLPQAVQKYSIDRHEVSADKPCLLKYDNLQGLFVGDDCILTISHPEHGETKYEALKGEMLALLPGTSHPFERDSRGD